MLPGILAPTISLGFPESFAFLMRIKIKLRALIIELLETWRNKQQLH